MEVVFTRIRLTEFTALTPPCRQYPTDYSVLTQAKPTPDRPEKILSIKEVGGRLATTRKGGMNQNTPNPGFALKWSHPCGPTHWMKKEGCLPNVSLLPLVVLDSQVWLPAWHGNGRNCPYGFRLTPEENAWKKLWRGPRPHRLQEQPGWNQSEQPGWNQREQPGWNQREQPGWNQREQPDTSSPPGDT